MAAGHRLCSLAGWALGGQGALSAVARATLVVEALLQRAQRFALGGGCPLRLA